MGSVILVLGGDARLRYAAEGFRALGYDTIDLPQADEAQLPLLQNADIVLLPVPALEGARIRNTSLHLDALRNAAPKAMLYGGRLPVRDERTIDYAQLEAFQQANALPTAEGAIQILLNQLPITLSGARILVIGCGRIGKVLAGKLKALGAVVTVSARKTQDYRYLAENGLHADTTGLYSCGLDYDSIVNTVPAEVLTETQLSTIPKGCFLLDLASMPGGFDHNRCRSLGLPVQHALALPGKTAPKTAGLILRDVVLEHFNQHRKGC